MSDLGLLERIQRLEDREAIKDLTALYCKYVTNGEGDRLVDELFTADGAFDLRAIGGEIHAGPSALKRYFGALKERSAVPLIHNHLIDVEGDTASGTCSVESQFSKGKSQGFIGHYEDRYRRQGGRWRFSERRVLYQLFPRPGTTV